MQIFLIQQAVFFLINWCLIEHSSGLSLDGEVYYLKKRWKRSELSEDSIDIRAFSGGFGSSLFTDTSGVDLRIPEKITKTDPLKRTSSTMFMIGEIEPMNSNKPIGMEEEDKKFAIGSFAGGDGTALFQNTNDVSLEAKGQVKTSFKPTVTMSPFKFKPMITEPERQTNSKPSLLRHSEVKSSGLAEQGNKLFKLPVTMSPFKFKPMVKAPQQHSSLQTTSYRQSIINDRQQNGILQQNIHSRRPYTSNNYANRSTMKSRQYHSINKPIYRLYRLRLNKYRSKSNRFKKPRSNRRLFSRPVQRSRGHMMPHVRKTCRLKRFKKILIRSCS